MTRQLPVATLRRMTGRQDDPRDSADARPPVSDAAAGSGRSMFERGRDLAGLSVAGITRRRIAIMLAALLSAWIVLALSRQVGEARDAANQANDLSRANQALSAQIADPHRGADPDPAAGLHRDRGARPRPRRPPGASVHPGSRCPGAARGRPGQRLGRTRCFDDPDRADRRLVRAALRIRQLDQRGRNPQPTRPRDHSPDRPIKGSA